METDDGLKERLEDVEVDGELEGNVALSEVELARLVSSLLRTAFTNTNVRNVGMYTGRQPTLDRITLVAGYDPSPTLPRVRSLGRPETQCQVLQMDHLPPHCSATWFDNGYDYVYQIAIHRNPRNDL
jgi:hypothetical protein